MRRAVLVLGMLVLLVGCDGGGSGTEADVPEGSETSAADIPVHADTEDASEPDGPPVVPGADYLIVAAADLLTTAEAFKAYREETGYTVSLATLEQVIAGGKTTTDTDVAIHIKTWVAMHWEARSADGPMFLLLVGDADPEFNNPQKTIPAVEWPGEWEDCLSDNHYGEMDGDHVPEVAVGRLPIRSDDQGLDLLDRIVAHETTYETGPWNHLLNVYAGEGGFGEDVDFFIETVAQKGLESVPMGFDLRFAYDSTGSNWYYAPFEEIVHEMVTTGAVLTTFMGHGGGELDVPDLTQVKPSDRYPMYAFFACSTGDYASDWMSESEEVMLQPGGPMAILVSTAVTHPYANAVNAIEMEAAVFEDQPATYGEAVVGMKSRSLYHESDLREFIDAFAETEMPIDEMEGTILDHMYSYNLLGDPAVLLRLPPPAVTLEATDAAPGDPVEVSGTADGLSSGTAHAKIVCGRASILHQLTPVDDPSDPANVAVIQENWEKAMDHTVVGAELALGPDGGFSGTLEVPEGTKKGTYWVAVYAEDGTSDAVGATEISIK